MCRFRPSSDGGEPVSPREVVAISTASQPGCDKEVVYLARRAPHPVFWVIAVASVVIATALVLRPLGIEAPVFESPAFAQGVTSGGARGVFAFSGQLSKTTYGVYVVDVDALTIWTYEYLPAKGCLRLAAARTWRYDRYLENHNICDLPPDMVEKMIEAQREYRLQSTEDEMP